MRQHLVRFGLLACAALVNPAAQADVWGYIDAKGVAHFAQEQLDERYELFFRSAPQPDSSRDAKGVEAGRAVAVPMPAPKLIAYFEVSPSFKQIKHLLREAATEHKIDFELLQALIATESGFDPQAVSPKGAVGLMQLMPDTARRFGVKDDLQTSVNQKLTDPRTNIRAGARYLRYLLNLFPGRVDLALAAYNAGEGAVQRAGNRIPNYRETQNYVRTITQMVAVLRPPPLLVEHRKTSPPVQKSPD